MTNGERAELLGRLRELGRAGEVAGIATIWGQSADQIEADGKRIAELEQDACDNATDAVKDGLRIKELTAQNETMLALMRELITHQGNDVWWANAIRAALAKIGDV